ncbi:MAG: hypothetical protein KBC92_15090 [Giesbergeria sp.]|nr:hypothetical protein [Giesbergeria sp.]
MKENGNSLSQDTKAYWKRRALKAEAEAATWRKIRSVDNCMEMQIVTENAALRVAVREIEEALSAIRSGMEVEAE